MWWSLQGMLPLPRRKLHSWVYDLEESFFGGEEGVGILCLYVEFNLTIQHYSAKTGLFGCMYYSCALFLFTFHSCVSISLWLKREKKRVDSFILSTLAWIGKKVLTCSVEYLCDFSKATKGIASVLFQWIHILKYIHQTHNLKRWLKLNRVTQFD